MKDVNNSMSVLEKSETLKEEDAVQNISAASDESMVSGSGNIPNSLGV